MKRGIRESNEVERMIFFFACSPLGNQGSHQQAEGYYLEGTDQCKGGWARRTEYENAQRPMYVRVSQWDIYHVPAIINL